jgi:hypothetical protein
MFRADFSGSERRPLFFDPAHYQIAGNLGIRRIHITISRQVFSDTTICPSQESFRKQYRILGFYQPSQTGMESRRMANHGHDVHKIPSLHPFYKTLDLVRQIFLFMTRDTSKPFDATSSVP